MCMKIYLVIFCLEGIMCCTITKTYTSDQASQMSSDAQ